MLFACHEMDAMSAEIRPVAVVGQPVREPRGLLLVVTV
jgi:hypothetical protein